MDRRPEITVVIPAYNEAERLPPFLERVIAYCAASERRYEIIVVDDGSTDDTFAVAEGHKPRCSDLRAIRLPENKGKGSAVRKGFQESTGEICLFLDADGSIEPDEIEKNIHYIVKEGYDIFIGSRAMKGAGTLVERNTCRKIFAWAYGLLVRTFLLKDIRDTTCGFKMFKKDVADDLFPRSIIKDYSFDMEILYLARKLGYSVKEGPVSWRHVDGSKVHVLSDTLKTLAHIIQIRRLHRHDAEK